MESKMRTLGLSVTAAVLALTVGSSQAAIVVLDTDSAVTASNSGPGDFTRADTDGDSATRDGVYSYAFDAGATSDMLVIALSGEWSGGAYTVSYAGKAMSLATQNSTGSGTSIWYLAKPSATGSIAIDFTAKDPVNGIGLGIASLNGNGQEIAFDKGVSDAGEKTINITTNFADSFVMFAGDANTTNRNPSLNDPLTTIYAGPDDIGSNQAAAGYENGVAAGSNTYSWNPGTVDTERGISAAAFYAVPEPASLATGLVGMLLIVGRRRRREMSWS